MTLRENGRSHHDVDLDVAQGDSSAKFASFGAVWEADCLVTMAKHHAVVGRHWYSPTLVLSSYAYERQPPFLLNRHSDNTKIANRVPSSIALNRLHLHMFQLFLRLVQTLLATYHTDCHIFTRTYQANVARGLTSEQRDLLLQGK